MKPCATESRRCRGVALLAVMWVVIVASLMLLSVQSVARANRALTHGELAAVQARWLARAGVEQALAILEDDDPAVDGVNEDWFRDPAEFEKIELDGGWFSVRSATDNNRPGLDDESSRLNLNSADKRQLTQLKTLSDVQIDSLIQWRTPSDAAGNNGAREGYYQNLRHPYESRGRDFQTHRELLLVQGFEDRAFFGPPTSSLAAGGPARDTTVYSYQANRTPQGLDRVNLNTASAATLQERLNLAPDLAQAVVQRQKSQPYQNLTALLDVRPQRGSRPGAAAGNVPRGGTPPVTEFTLDWLAEHSEELSVSDEQRLPGKININTASRQVLLTLPGLTEELADQVVAQRISSTGAFKSLAELLQRRVVTQEVFRGFWEKLTVRSDVFTVESLGVSSFGVRRRILAVIDRGTTPASILYWYESP